MRHRIGVAVAIVLGVLASIPVFIILMILGHWLTGH